MLKSIIISTRKFSQSCIKNVRLNGVTTLQDLYPESSLDITKEYEKPLCPKDGYSGCIPMETLEVIYESSLHSSHARPYFPNTRTTVRIDLKSAEWVSDSLKEKVRQKYPYAVDSEDRLTATSDKTNSQYLNRADALDTIRCMVRNCFEPPPTPTYKEPEIERLTSQKEARNKLRIKKTS